MKLTLPAAILDKALARTERVIEKRNTIPILSNIRLSAAPGLLEITGTDLDIELRTAIEAKVAEPGSTTLPATMLKQIAAKAKGSDITIAVEGDEATITAGRARWSLQVLPATDYPDFGLEEFPTRFNLPAPGLARMAAKLSFAISTEETRYYLNGIFFHRAGDALAAVATDGHRLGRIHLPLPEGAGDGWPGVIIPRKAVAEIERLAGTAEAGADVTIELSETKIRVTLDRTVLTSKLIDGTFPDYKRVIPAPSENRATIDRSALAAAVDRVSTIAAEKGRAMKLEFSPRQLALSCTNPDAGIASETIEVEFTGEPATLGEPFTIGFNARYVGEALARLELASLVLDMPAPGSPARLHEPGKDEDFLIVLMPMRV